MNFSLEFIAKLFYLFLRFQLVNKEGIVLLVFSDIMNRYIYFIEY